MKKIILSTFSFVLCLSIFAQTSYAISYHFCDQYKGVKKVLWDGKELINNQIGRITILNPTPLYKYNSRGYSTKSRMLKKGEFYRVLKINSDKLFVGGAYYVVRDAKVKFEVPSNTLIDEFKCINGNHITQIYRKQLNTETLWNLFDKFNTIYENELKNKNDYPVLVSELEPLADEYRQLPNLTPEQKNVFENVFLKSSNPYYPRVFSSVINKIVVKFNNGESYLQERYYSYKVINNKIYLSLNSLANLYGLLNGVYEARKIENLPGGLNGQIFAYDLPIQSEKVYTNINDINSNYYEKYELIREGSPSITNFDSRANIIPGSEVFTTLDLNEITKLFNKVEIKPNGNILEVYIDELPRM